MSENFERIRELLLAALERPAAERAAWLDEACGDNEALRAAVQSLLDQEDSGGEFLRTAGAFGLADAEVALPERIGPYRIKEMLGEGGFGVVYAAEQTEPVKREVALKLLKRGMDTRAVLERFGAERQALAYMEHPNIARILDAGETENGLPYFVMERIRGLPITEHCARNGLDARERIDLFTQVCAGIQHAHGKGVIHRDIKPSNILVAMEGGRAVPKVIDFGIAKALHPSLEDLAALTFGGQAIGTPSYMAPEQAVGGAVADVTADVYSLGAVLYELLSGAPPFETETLVAAGVDGMFRILREQDPPTPSTRVSRAGAEPSRGPLRPGELRGELDWITMTAIAKEPARRYGSAAALADDLSRHLRHEPVQASPLGAAYQMRKFARRHRLGVALAAAGLAVLLAFTAVTAFQSRRVARERDRAERIAGFLAEMLATVDPEAVGTGLWDDLRGRVASGEEFDRLFEDVNPTDAALRLLDEEVLAPAGRTIDDELGDDPQLAARMRVRFGQAYRALGLYERAEPYHREALDQQIALLGHGHQETIHNQNGLAVLLEDMDRYAEAESLALDALGRARASLGEESKEVLSALNNLGVILSRTGREEEAEAMRREALELHRRVLGDDHVETIVAIGSLGIQLHEVGEFDEAEPLLRECVERADRALEEDSSVRLTALNNLGMLLDTTGRYAEAEPLKLEIVEISRRVRGEDHPETLTFALNYVASLDLQEKFDEAEVAYREVLERLVRVLGDHHTLTLTTRASLGAMLTAMERFEDAEVMLRAAYQGYLATVGPDNFMTLNAESNLGAVLTEQGRLDEATALLDDTLARMDAALPEGHWFRAKLIRNSGACLLARGLHEEAEARLLHAHEVFQGTFGDEGFHTKLAVELLVELYESWGRTGSATEWRARLPRE